MKTTLKLAAVAASVALLAGCATAQAAPQIDTPPAVDVQLPETPAYVEPIVPTTFTAVGDSITAGPSWTIYTNDEHVEFQPGGFAVGGTKVCEQAAGTVPISSTWLAFAGGVNDMGTPRWATPMGERIACVDLIVVQSQAQRVVLLAASPRDMDGRLPGDPQWVADWNAQLQALAAVRGWDYFDMWSTLRAADGQWVEGMTTDGVHPTDEGQRIAGAAFGAWLASKGA